MKRNASRLADEPDLFDVAAADEASDDVHMILPHFATACGLGFLEVNRTGRLKGKKLWTLTVEDTTCPACQAAGDLHAMCRQIMGRQAEVEN